VFELLGEPLVLSSEPVHLQCSIESEKLKYMGDVNKAIRDIKKELVLDKMLSFYQ